MPIFNPVEKRAHYSGVASGDLPVKANSQFTEETQRAYARGQRDARNEAAASYVWKNATPEERVKIKENRKARNEAYKANQGNSAKPTKQTKK